MHSKQIGPIATVLALLILLTTPVFAQAATADTGESSPWWALEQVRLKLARRGATTAPFEQTFVAAGFSGGETETGRLTFSLPDCLRWDYADPYPKSFLVCQDTVWYWNEHDMTGRRQEIDSRNEPGLDLLLLSVDSLAERYTASTEENDEGQVVLTLAPKVEAGEIQEAWLTLDPDGGRVVRLEYRDLAGNRTTFTIGDHTPLAEGEKLSPPKGVHWEEG